MMGWINNLNFVKRETIDCLIIC